MVIVGNGHAGFQVAVSLRKLGFAGPVTLVGDEDGLPYQRPPLSKEWLHGTLETDDLPFRPRSFYKKKDIDLLAGEQVVGIDREGGTVDLASGATLGYENLVLATGARCRPVDIDGIGLDGVVELRTRADAEDLNTRLDAARRVVVVGGGFIGLEAAAAASKRGAEVTVIEAADRVMTRVVSPGISRYATQVHRDEGTTVLLDAQVASFAEGAGGRVAGATLCDGTELAADVVIVGVGVVANDGLAADAGLVTSDGVEVDAGLRASGERIWAIGDCASFPRPGREGHVRLESVQNATDHARHVAAAIVGGDGTYDAVPWFWSYQHDCKLQIAGLTDGHDRAVVRGDPESGTFSVFCFAGGRLVGVESVNGPRDHLAARKLLGAGVACEERQVTDPDFDLRSLVTKARA